MNNLNFLEAFNGHKVSVIIKGWQKEETYVGELIYVNEETIGLAFEKYKTAKSDFYLDFIFFDKEILKSIWIYKK
jgi:hypothetical protein